MFVFSTTNEVEKMNMSRADYIYETMLRVPESVEEGSSEWYDEDKGCIVWFFTDGNGNIIEVKPYESPAWRTSYPRRIR